ncbi:CocE/NonD family hydrolase [Tomitella gaofuii]|uniref:CocE/NonD family hydrolase n=1 Tax=Tomitella gaofuii TaxID=2760083 RepID=UPI0015F99EE1|nr:CocE/NonD family hydrolase [Tomitella gaofuii]
MRIERDAAFTTGDGEHVKADIYRPDMLPAPVILQRTPYTKDWHVELGERIARAGYIGIIQDVRGQNASTGAWDPFVNEADDGAAAVEWAAGVDGCDGRVALIGTSYAGATALKAATRRPESLVAVVAAETPADYYDDTVFPGGVLALAFIETWLLRNIANSAAGRLSDGPDIQRAMTDVYENRMDEAFQFTPPIGLPALHPDRSEIAPYFASWLGPHRTRTTYWDDISLRPVLTDIDVPVLVIGGWYDVFVGGTIEIFQRLAAAGRDTRLLVGPWSHNMWGRTMNGIDFGPSAEFDFVAEAIAWVDRCLGIERPRIRAGANWGHFDSPVRYFTTGDCLWHTADGWPPTSSAPITLELGVGCTLGGEPGEEGVVEFDSDPADPVPALGGHSCCYQPQSPMGPMDQRLIEALPAVVSFSTAAAEQAWTIVGPVEVALEMTTDVPDTDLTAVLTDVHPDGTSINLTEGVLRASHRRGSVAPEPLVPGKRTAFVLRLLPTAHTILPGHRLRLNLAGSLFPTFERNPNTGRIDDPIHDAAVAHVEVHVGGGSGSALTLRRA